MIEKVEKMTFGRHERTEAAEEALRDIARRWVREVVPELTRDVVPELKRAMTEDEAVEGVIARIDAGELELVRDAEPDERGVRGYFIRYAEGRTP
jgi:hypothetical protein